MYGQAIGVPIPSIEDLHQPLIGGAWVFRSSDWPADDQVGRPATHRVRGLDRPHLIPCGFARRANTGDYDPRLGAKCLAQQAELLPRGDDTAQPRLYRGPRKAFGFESDVGHAASQDALELAGVM